jgi:hypothetical protein
MFSTRAQSVGETAARQLEKEGFIGKIHSNFRNSINILLPSNRIITIVSRKSENSKISLKVDANHFPLRNIEIKNQGVSIYEDVMSIGGMAKIEGIKKARVWRPEISLPRKVYIPRLYRNTSTALNEIKIHGRPEGFKPLLPYLKCMLKNRNNKKGKVKLDKTTYQTDYAFPLIRNMVNNLFEKDVGRAVENGKGLIGLGVGLTPSGDDFLCGFMAMLSTVFSGYLAEEREFFEKFNSHLVTQIEARTNLISREYLIIHSRGNPTESTCNMIQDVVDGSSNMKNSIKKLCEVGHSSGTDIAIGVVLGFCILYKKVLHSPRNFLSLD